MLITEKDFENLFNTLVVKVMQNGDQGKRKLFDAISDVYEIKEYIPEITLFEKQEKENILYFRYESNYVNTDRMVLCKRHEDIIGEYRDYRFDISENIDLHTTLKSFNTFFKYYLIATATKEALIDRDSIKTIILPAINLLITYIKNTKTRE